MLKKIKFLLILMILFFGQPVLASDIVWSVDENNIGVGDFSLVTLSVNTGRQTINAIEGTVLVPASLAVKEIRLGGSLVNFWIQEPKEIKTGEIRFSGITPGGYRESDFEIFSLVVEAKTVGQVKISPSDFRILLNDGAGTADEVETSVATINIDSQVIGKKLVKFPDSVAPESFDIQIGQDPNLFEGKNFAIFYASDKGVGVDHYEIKESKSQLLSFFKSWQVAESPYLLIDQSLKSFVWVKAIDKNNNSQTVLEKPSNPLSLYLNYDFWIIIVLISIIILVVYKKWILNRRR